VRRVTAEPAAVDIAEHDQPKKFAQEFVMTDFDLTAFSKAIADRAENAAAHTASISVHHHHSASAFHWRDGLYVAAEELVDPDAEVETTFASGESVKTEIVGRDASTGIVLIKPAGAQKLTPLKRAKDARAGSIVIVAGRNGASPLTGFGVVNEAGPAWRSMRGGQIDRRIGLSVGLDGRFEGAAALDAEGALIGMVLFGPRRRALVIPAETIDRVAPVLAEKGRVARGYLGAGLHPVRDAALNGAMVMRLDDDGPAKRAGLHLGDIITQWNGEAIAGSRDVIRRLGSDSVGTTVTLTLLRGGAEQKADVTIGERPAA
jgi:S1-C subfamily serine protease